MRNPNESIRQTAKRYATGGSGTMLIYTGDAEDYLKERNIKYDKNDPFETYANVMAEKIEKLYNDANKSKYDKKYNSMDEVIADKDSALNQYIRNKANEKKAFRQYKKDHPNSDMTLKQFREMNK